MGNNGRLTEVDVRELWRHEQYDFSNWLAQPACVQTVSVRGYTHT